MLSTKAFADLCDTSKKTIIHYDRIKLLKPLRVNDKQFRFYQPKQVLIFQKIQMLKSFGLSLQEIKKYLKHNSRLLKLFSKQKKELKEKLDILQKRINKINEFKSNLSQHKVIIIPKIKTIKPYAFYGIDKIGRYVDINKHQQEIYALKGEKKAHSAGLTVFHEQGYKPDKASMTTGVLIKEKNPKKITGTKIIKVPSYKSVVYTHIGPYSYLSYAWQFVNKFAKENKLKRHPSIAERELYLIGPLSGAKQDDFVTELQIPIVQPFEHTQGLHFDRLSAGNS